MKVQAATGPATGSAAILEGRPMGAKPIRWMMTGAGKPFVPMEFEIGTLGPDEVLVEIAGCGVCHTDLGYYYDGVRTKHELPLALGHEISGHVIDTGTDALWYTDRARSVNQRASVPVSMTWPLISCPSASGSSCLVRTPS